MSRQQRATVLEPSPSGEAPLLAASDLSISFPVHQRGSKGAKAHAVRGVSLQLERGKTFGLLGESGSGKSTLGRLLMHLIRPDAGEIRIDGEDLWAMSSRDRRQMRSRMQMVFQDPHASFDPSRPLLHSLDEPLKVHTKDSSAVRRRRIAEVVEAVGLRDLHLARLPRNLSGGQLQRMAIARALTLNPQLLVLDEPVSALDMSTQAQIINLLQELQASLDLTYVFISHNPSVVHHLAHRIGVMYLGELVEEGPADRVMGEPQHPYTKALLGSVLTPHVGASRSSRSRAVGEIASNVNLPSGCSFHTRCPVRLEICSDVAPSAVESSGATVTCHLIAGTSVRSEPEAT